MGGGSTPNQMVGGTLFGGGQFWFQIFVLHGKNRANLPLGGTHSAPPPPRAGSPKTSAGNLGPISASRASRSSACGRWITKGLHSLRLRWRGRSPTMPSCMTTQCLYGGIGPLARPVLLQRCLCSQWKNQVLSPESNCMICEKCSTISRVAIFFMFFYVMLCHVIHAIMTWQNATRLNFKGLLTLLPGGQCLLVWAGTPRARFGPIGGHGDSAWALDQKKA